MNEELKALERAFDKAVEMYGKEKLAKAINQKGQNMDNETQQIIISCIREVFATMQYSDIVKFFEGFKE